jgi:competence protein ComGC
MFYIDFTNEQQSNPFALVSLFVVIAVIITLGLYALIKMRKSKEQIL